MIVRRKRRSEGCVVVTFTRTGHVLLTSIGLLRLHRFKPCVWLGYPREWFGWEIGVKNKLGHTAVLCRDRLPTVCHTPFAYGVLFQAAAPFIFYCWTSHYIKCFGHPVGRKARKRSEINSMHSRFAYRHVPWELTGLWCLVSKDTQSWQGPSRHSHLRTNKQDTTDWSDPTAAGIRVEGSLSPCYKSRFERC